MIEMTKEELGLLRQALSHWINNLRTYVKNHEVAQTIQFNFPRPVITIKMFNDWPKGATLVDASSILSV